MERRDRRDFIRASGMGEYLFCARAWWMRREVFKPPRLVEAEGGVVPVEVKSSACPSDGRPRDSHVAQLAAYCLLVEDVIGAAVPFGLIKYRDREVRVEYTDELRQWALALIEEMRAASD